MSTRSLYSHYIVTALRNVAKHKLYSFINIAGLSVGLTCAIFIALFIRDELSYDRWIPDSANLYRIELTFHMRGRPPWPLASAPFPILRAIQDRIPEVKATAHLVPESKTVTIGDRQFVETVALVDPNFFQVIKLPLAEGDPTQVLAQPESVVLSQSIARKYFGNADPLGRIVTVTGSGIMCDRSDAACLTAAHPLTVTGVLRDLPPNTQLAADLIVPNTSQADELPVAFREQAWFSTNGSFNYVALAPGADPNQVLAKLEPVLDQIIKADPSGERPSELEQYHLTRFWDAHLTSDQYGGMQPPGSWTTVYGFAIIGLLIMIVAGFNFMNLATARATLRAREISLRKAVGASRAQLITQFLGEALLMAVLSLLIALALVEVLLPVYNSFLDRHIAFNYWSDWSFLMAVIASAIFAGLLSGIYPALLLSGFRPAAVLKTSGANQGGSGVLRTALVVAQFSVSIGLGIAAIVVFSQIRYAQNIALGFNRDGVLILRGITALAPPATESFAQALRSNPKIAEVAFSNGVPFDLFNVSNIPIQIQGQPQSFTAHILDIGPEYPPLYGMRLLAGRLLSSAHGADAFISYPFFSSHPASDPDLGRNVLINEEAAHRFGYTADEVVGKTIVGGNHALVTIAGVLGNSMIDGLKESVQPALYVDYPQSYTLLSIRIHAGQTAETLAFIDKTWHSFVPGSAIQRYWLDDTFDGLFKPDEKQGVMYSLFVGIAIWISCLGLFGMAAFTAQRRTKEIGIRKVFGARTRDVIRLLLWQFSIPVLIANAVAWPIAYYYLHHWLEGYAYRIPLNPLYFIAAGAAALVIAWITIFAHALRVARSSPIRALRYE
jgi:putative ABC transport system permease protein